MKQRQLEDKRRVLDEEHQNGIVFPVSDTHRCVAAGDEESLGTRVLLGREDNAQVLV